MGLVIEALPSLPWHGAPLTRTVPAPWHACTQHTNKHKHEVRAKAQHDLDVTIRLSVAKEVVVSLEELAEIQ
jgi:hypothetical protein